MADNNQSPQHGQTPEPVTLRDGAAEIVQTLRRSLFMLPQVALTPFIVVFLVQGGAFLASGGAMMELENETPQISPLAIAALPVIILAYAVFMVDWLRLLLLGPSPETTRPRTTLRSRDFRFLFRCLLVILMGFLGALPVALLAPALVPIGGIVLVAILSVVLAVTTMLAVGLVLPGTAIDREFSFGDSWRATREVLSSLLGLVLIVVLPVHLLAMLMAMLYGATMGMHGLMVPLLALSIAMEFIELAVVATLLAVVYRRRVGVDQTNPGGGGANGS